MDLFEFVYELILELCANRSGTKPMSKAVKVIVISITVIAVAALIFGIVLLVQDNRTGLLPVWVSLLVLCAVGIFCLAQKS
jgi:hypothetical protein